MKKFIKATILGGVLFLIPLSLVTILLLKIFGFMLQIAEVVDQFIPIHSVFGIATANILAILLIVLVCFLFGLLASNKRIDHFKKLIEKNVLMKIPGYLFIKAYTKGLEINKKEPYELAPVLVLFDDNAQLGFLVEKKEKGLSSVFMPGAPNPWSGNVIYVEQERIKRLGITTSQAIKHLQLAGQNSDFINEDNP